MSKARAGLFLDMGMGKTAAVLSAVLFRIKVTQDVKHVLIVAPLLVAETTWRDELAKWDIFEGLTYSFIGGKNASERREALRKDVHIYTISCDNFVWLYELVKSKFSYFDMIVIDESSRFKNPNAKKSKAMRDAQQLVKYFVILTGTPSPNGMLDLWQQVAFLDNDALASRYTQFRTKYFDKAGYMGYEYKLKSGARETILEKIKPFTISMKTDDFPELNMDAAEYINVYVPYTTDELKAYNSFEREAYLSFISQTEQQGMGASEQQRVEIVAANKAALYNKLLQFTSGRIYDEEKVAHVLHNKKTNRIAEMIDEFNDDPALIAYSFTHERDAIVDKVRGAEAKTTQGDFVARWNHGNIRALVLHPASAGHGLNLQDGGRYIIWPTPTWNLEHYLQFNKRLHRQGQKRKVFIYHLITPGTIDELVMSRLADKDKDQDAIFDALRQKYGGN